MKINYFTHFIKDNISGERYKIELLSFFDAFLNGATPNFKASLKNHGEHVFFMPTSAGRGMYLFGVTRSDEVIKKINMSEYTASEIKDLLSDGESMGFSSYFFPRNDFFAFGSTLMAPKLPLFVAFVNELLGRFGFSSFELVVSPILQEVTTEDVFAMESVGRTTISLEKNNGLAASILGLINAGTQDYVDLEGIDIVFKPRKRKSIKGVVRKLNSAIGEVGIHKYVIKAAEEINDSSVEYYLVGKGGVHDFIDTRDEKTILEKVNGRISSNSLLMEKVDKFNENFTFEPIHCGGILSAYDASTWGSVR